MCLLHNTAFAALKTPLPTLSQTTETLIDVSKIFKMKSWKIVAMLGGSAFAVAYGTSAGGELGKRTADFAADSISSMLLWLSERLLELSHLVQELLKQRSSATMVPANENGEFEPSKHVGEDIRSRRCCRLTFGFQEHSARISGDGGEKVIATRGFCNFQLVGDGVLHSHPFRR